MKGIYIFLADGFEEIEALGTNDLLRRAGLRTELISIKEEPFVSSAHSITVGVDDCFSFLSKNADHSGTTEKDFLIFPGGMPGAKTLSENKALIEFMQAHYDAGGSLAGICAAPGLVLSQLKGIKDAKVTCYDGYEVKLVEAGARFEPKSAITSGRIITGRGAGHAVNFALEIIKKAAPDKLEDVKYKVLQNTPV